MLRIGFELLKYKISSWWREEEAVAAVEASFIFPVMLTLMVGVFDVGNGILANQKAVRASQVVADLIARKNIVSETDVQDAIKAGRLALEPLNSDSLGVDIISIRFDPANGTEIDWRETDNMTPIDDVEARVNPLYADGEGVVMVAVVYDYHPIVTGFVMDSFQMSEVAFSRGRRSPVVTHE